MTTTTNYAPGSDLDRLVRVEEQSREISGYAIPASFRVRYGGRWHTGTLSQPITNRLRVRDSRKGSHSQYQTVFDFSDLQVCFHHDRRYSPLADRIDELEQNVAAHRALEGTRR